MGAGLLLLLLLRRGDQLLRRGRQDQVTLALLLLLEECSCPVLVVPGLASVVPGHVDGQLAVGAAAVAADL